MKYFETENGWINDSNLQVHYQERYKPRNNLNPLDWRHNNLDLLAPIGKDIFINNLTYSEIAKKYEISDRTVLNLANRLQPKHLERVRVGEKWEWRERKSMKIRLELELENRAWSASDLILALSRCIQGLDGRPGGGPIEDPKGRTIGEWAVSTIQSETTNHKVEMVPEEKKVGRRRPSGSSKAVSS